MNILLPIAGKAQRFIDAGFNVPKPLIMADTKHIIDWAMDSIDYKNHRLIFAVRLDHIYNFSIDSILKEKFGNDIDIVIIDGITEGSICTCLLAENLIDNDEPLLIYTPDVCFKPLFATDDIPEELDGLILTFRANSANHSYVQIDKNQLVIRTAEKEVISQNAAVGIYYYKSGKTFVKYAKDMIEKDIRTKGEFYICPMYNLMVEDGLKVGVKEAEKMYVLGTPEELGFFASRSVNRIGDRPIGICADHSGYVLKEEIVRFLREEGIKHVDFGTYNSKSCDYFDYVSQVVRAMQDGVCDFGIGVCRTGQGINISANKCDDIFSGIIFDKYTAEYSIKHNCCNFFSVPSKYVTIDEFKKMFSVMRDSSFDSGRHMTRIQKFWSPSR